MNERIRELEIEAIAYADSKVPAMDRYNDIYHSIVRGKFAELIVVKCANIVWDEAHKTDNAEINDVGYKILEHFGVEE